MIDFRKVWIIPVFATWIFSAGCDKKKVALQPPPPHPMPTSQLPTRRPRTTGQTTRTTPPPPAAPAPESNISRYPDKATRDRIDTLLARISDAYFDYDKHTLRPDAVQTLQADATELRDIFKEYPEYKLVIEGTRRARLGRIQHRLR